MVSTHGGTKKAEEERQEEHCQKKWGLIEANNGGRTDRQRMDRQQTYRLQTDETQAEEAQKIDPIIFQTDALILMWMEF